ncbi:MAG TPA: helix-turn-helix transcriptional regulator [Mucilaginibacter sp.]|nr:helix-turn-helix transcriptional regulator [Mucilaginibacter sp.]
MGKTTYNRIKSVLAEKEKTNLFLAEQLEVAPETVSKWCTNTAQPSIEKLFAVARALDVDVRILLISTKS